MLISYFPHITPILLLQQSKDFRLPDDGLVKPKHVGAFIVNLTINFNILKQFNCALVGQIKDLIKS